MTVLIAGGGIAGLSLALACEQIGVPFQVFEAAAEIKPLGVGINLQPTAVRELYELGFEERLDAIGVQTTGCTPRRETTSGPSPAENTPVITGPNTRYIVACCISRSMRLCSNGPGPAVCRPAGRRPGIGMKQTPLFYASARVTERRSPFEAISYSVRTASTQRYASRCIPNRVIQHKGAVLWRGTTRAKPFLSGASMVMIGYSGLRFVSYPISKPDSETGEATINWIANLNYEADQPWNKEDYSREANLEDFLPRFADLAFDWIDCPALIRGADKIFEYPMVDREPVDRWTDGRVPLTGDAAHAAYPVGSNGAGSAIIDARLLGAKFIEHGLTPAALNAFEAEMLEPASKVVLMNRTAGPDSILDTVEERSGGVFGDIEEVIPYAEMAAHASRYKSAAGFGIEETNAKPPTIPLGATYDGSSGHG